MNLCRFSTRLLVALCSMLIAVSAFAQFQTGNIYDKVVAKDCSALSGVTVTLTGVGAPQTSIADAQGNDRFLNLSPGTDDIKAELAGFGTSSSGASPVTVIDSVTDGFKGLATSAFAPTCTPWRRISAS